MRRKKKCSRCVLGLYCLTVLATQRFRFVWYACRHCHAWVLLYDKQTGYFIGWAAKEELDNMQLGVGCAQMGSTDTYHICRACERQKLDALVHQVLRWTD